MVKRTGCGPAMKRVRSRASRQCLPCSQLERQTESPKSFTTKARRTRRARRDHDSPLQQLKSKKVTKQKTVNERQPVIRVIDHNSFHSFVSFVFFVPLW